MKMGRRPDSWVGVPNRHVTWNRPTKTGKDHSEYPGKHTIHTRIRTTHQTQEQNHFQKTGINTTTHLNHPPTAHNDMWHEIHPQKRERTRANILSSTPRWTTNKTPTWYTECLNLVRTSAKELTGEKLLPMNHSDINTNQISHHTMSHGEGTVLENKKWNWY
jgi:hypothetical protein